MQKKQQKKHSIINFTLDILLGLREGGRGAKSPGSGPRRGSRGWGGKKEVKNKKNEKKGRKRDPGPKKASARAHSN